MRTLPKELRLPQASQASKIISKFRICFLIIVYAECLPPAKSSRKAFCYQVVFPVV